MQRTTDTNAWQNFLSSRGIHPPLAAIWAQRARPNIRLLSDRVVEPDNTAIGASKLWGSPDLPRSTDWPTRPAYSYQGRRREHVDPEAFASQPLEFMAQINLADVAQAGCDLPLPEKGILLFFYDAQIQPWGFDPCDGVGTRVMYAELEDGLRRYAAPPKSSSARPLKLEPGESIPGWEWIQPIASKLPGYNRENFHAELEGFEDEDYERMAFGGHCFGGWPSLIQGPMELECQLASNGIYVGGPDAYADPRRLELEKSANEWRLLLQLDSDDAQGWMWGDVGRLYFWCRTSDIEARRFDRVWTVLQCT